MNDKPSFKEVGGKIAKARQIISSALDRVIIIDRLKWDEEWDRLRIELGIQADEVALFSDRLTIIDTCLSEIEPSDHLWRGSRMYCNKPKFADVELWEFRWTSKMFVNKGLYLKFGFKQEKLCFLSFHPDEPERKVRK